MSRTVKTGVASPRAIETTITTQDGLRAYDLDPQSPELLTIAGPCGCDPTMIDFDDLPLGFRIIGVDEWEQLHNQT